MLSCGMVLVLGGLQVMAECNPSMMSGLLVIAHLVKLGGLRGPRLRKTKNYFAAKA
jgi:hypothetical protein